VTVVSAQHGFDPERHPCLFVRFDNGRKVVIYADNQKFIRYGVPVVNLGPAFNDLPPLIMEPGEYPTLGLGRPFSAAGAVRDETLARLVREFLEQTDNREFRPGPVSL
jgi:hypothetical protein